MIHAKILNNLVIIMNSCNLIKGACGKTRANIITNGGKNDCCFLRLGTKQEYMILPLFKNFLSYIGV